MSYVKYRRIICRECGCVPATGRDPETGKPWRQCACDPYPASMKITKHGFVATPADPTPEEIEAYTGQPFVDDSLQEVEREIAARLAGSAVRREVAGWTAGAAVDPEIEPVIGIECNGRIILYREDCFLPTPLSHTPHCMSRSRSECARVGRQAEEPTSTIVRWAKKNVGNE